MGADVVVDVDEVVGACVGDFVVGATVVGAGVVTGAELDDAEDELLCDVGGVSVLSLYNKMSAQLTNDSCFP